MTDKCIICFDELHSNIGVITPCGHAFHRDCFRALKQNAEKNQQDSDDGSDSSSNNNNNSGKLPRCPVCKGKSKKFIDVYLTFEERRYCSNTIEDNNGIGGDSTSSNSDSLLPRRTRSLSSSFEEDATQALASLTSENMHLRKSLQETKSISKSQGELLLEVLPKFDSIQSQLLETTRDKEDIEKELRDVEEENSELLTGWNDIEMKMQMIKFEKEELEDKLRETKRKNNVLNAKWNELDLKLIKAKKRRKILESKQADELNGVKVQVRQSNTEKEELFGLLKKSQSKATNLKRIIKKMKRKQFRDENRGVSSSTAAKKRTKLC